MIIQNTPISNSFFDFSKAIMSWWFFFLIFYIIASLFFHKFVWIWVLLYKENWNDWLFLCNDICLYRMLISLDDMLYKIIIFGYNIISFIEFPSTAYHSRAKECKYCTVSYIMRIRNQMSSRTNIINLYIYQYTCIHSLWCIYFTTDIKE